MIKYFLYVHEVAPDSLSETEKKEFNFLYEKEYLVGRNGHRLPLVDNYGEEVSIEEFKKYIRATDFFSGFDVIDFKSLDKEYHVRSDVKYIVSTVSLEFI